MNHDILILALGAVALIWIGVIAECRKSKKLSEGIAQIYKDMEA